MGHHKRFGGWRHARNQYYGRGRPPVLDPVSQGFRGEAPRLGRAKPLLWAVALAGVGLWSLIAWVAYGVVEPFFGWAAANAGPFASGLGAGGIGALLGQMSAWLQSIARPAIIIVWAVGALGLLAAPMILPAVIRLRGGLYR